MPPRRTYIALEESGQALVLSMVFLVALLGVAAATIDVGAWYRTQRQAQATADAAALAAAGELPAATTGAAVNRALEYAGKNGGGLAAGDVTFSSALNTNDTVSVRVRRPAPLFFAKVLGVKSVTASGRSTARAEPVSSVGGVAPIVVHYKHPLLNCTQVRMPQCAPTFGVSTTLTLSDLHSPGGGSASGAFGLINLNQGDASGTADAGTLAGWLTNGYDGSLPLGIYFSAPSANFNNSQFLAALAGKVGTEVLFPVYRLLTGPGSNAKYDIIGWVGFVIQSYTATGSSGTLTGYFSRWTTDGVQQDTGGGTDLGTVAVELVQ
jgi:hypothetical protein